MQFLAQILLLILFFSGTTTVVADSIISNKTGLLIMAHGGDAEWNDAVKKAVYPLRFFCPVEIAFGMAQRDSLQQAIYNLESRGVNQIAVVRLFVATESFRHQTEYLLGLRSDPPNMFINHSAHSEVPLTHPNSIHMLSSEMAPDPVQIKSAIAINQDGLYDSKMIGEIIAARVQNLSLYPEKESVLILAHGEGNDTINQKWIFKLNLLADSVRQLGPFRTVQVATLREDWHSKRIRAEKKIRQFVQKGNESQGQVIVIPFRLFGFGPYRSVLKNLEYISDGKALLPHLAVTEWIKEQAVTCLQNLGASDPFQAGDLSSRIDINND